MEPHATHLATVRETRNLLVHSTLINDSQPFEVTPEIEQYLSDIVHFAKVNRAVLHREYIKKYVRNTEHKKFIRRESDNLVGSHIINQEQPTSRQIVDRQKKVTSNRVIPSEPYSYTAKEISKSILRDNLFGSKKGEDTNKLLNVTIRMIKNWSPSDKRAILDTYGVSKNFFKNINRQVAETLILNLPRSELRALLRDVL